MNRQLKYLYNELQKIMSSNFKRGRKLKNRAYSMMSNYFIIEKKKSLFYGYVQRVPIKLYAIIILFGDAVVSKFK
jgi:hypothetical protein